MVFLATLLFSVFITIALVPIFTRVALRIGLVDVPDERKVHTLPVPRSGGIAIAVGTLAPILLLTHGNDFVKWYLVGGGIILLSGLVDDIKGLKARTKFAAQVTAALIAVFFGGVRIENLGMLLPDGLLLPGWIAIPLTLLTIVGVTNAINLSDGLDGLAGGICLLIFSCIAYLAYLVEAPVIALLSVAMAGALLGFLRFNTYPASIFMGDTGSQFLGFSAILFSLQLTQSEACLSPLLPLLILGLPVLDTLAVMAQRLQERRSPLLGRQKPPPSPPHPSGSLPDRVGPPDLCPPVDPGHLCSHPEVLLRMADSDRLPRFFRPGDWGFHAFGQNRLQGQAVRLL